MALITVMNVVEAFFNWRSRWVLAEERPRRFRGNALCTVSRAVSAGTGSYDPDRVERPEPSIPLIGAPG